MSKSKLSKGWSLFVLMTKLTKIFKSLTTALKAVKAFGPLLTLGTMTLSIWAYSYSLGVPLAIAFVLLLLVHEMGHVIACWHKGYKVKAPLFIPFIGALIFAPRDMSRENESYIGYGGPLLGSLASILTWGLWAMTPSHPEVLLMGAYFGVFLNLFNLMPISPLDGGRILQSVGTWIRWVGLSILLVITIFLNDVGWLFIWIVVMSDFKIRHRKYITAFIWTLMLIGYAVDYGIYTHITIKVIHLILGLILAVVTWFIDTHMEGEEEEVRPPQPRKRAFAWLSYYLLLALVLTASLLIISHQVQPIMEKKKQQEQLDASAVKKTVQ